ncbi:unnamed protein product [Acanthoscelides obtectus]|uniref:Uncharacterized protein n=1 Tax=Acanthoscelides obtectus TaxID=200917 RepID=A0A9P0NYH3_ACAOB|nr:unnamed protein product [Acanthoscelides obtectus]CAK1661743.1 hypothetical protein AOBTE_LOCUS22769 [Acanthoscelides obtectus]
MIEKTRMKREAMALLAFSDVDDTLIDHDYVFVLQSTLTQKIIISLYKMLELQNRYLYKMLELQNDICTRCWNCKTDICTRCWNCKTDICTRCWNCKTDIRLGETTFVFDRSGIEEVYNEREHMLQEASELMKETCSTTPAKKKKVENKAKDMIEKTRNEREAMALLAFSDVFVLQSTLTQKIIISLYKMLELQNRYLYQMLELQNRYLYKIPPYQKDDKSKTLRKNGLDYLREKAEISREIRSAELKLEEQKMDNEKEKIANDKARLALESKRLEAEIQEKKHRIELEQKKSEQDVAERKNLSDLIKTQQKLIEALLTKLDNR